eukprot:5876481-Amphidinium_carterae.1
MNKGKGRGRGSGHQRSGGKGGRGRKPSSRGRTPSRSPQKPKGSSRKPPGLAHPSAHMFNVVPAPYDPLDDINPNNPPDPHSEFTSEEDFYDHPEAAMGLPVWEKRIIQKAVHMRFNRDHPP